MGKITVYFRDLNYLGDDSYHHEFIVWTDDHGNQKFIRGGPKPGQGGGSGSSGVAEPGSGSDVPFGSIWVSSGTYNNAARDYPKSGTDPGEVVATGPDSQLAPDFQKMVDEGNKINSEKIAYAFAGPNSNTVVTTLLQAAGLALPDHNKLDDPLAAPGADRSLENGQYSATKGYLKLLSNVVHRGLHDLERDIVGPTGTLPATHESPRAAEDGFRSPVANAKAAAAAARAAYAAKRAAENAANPTGALRANLMAIARSKPISVAPVSGAKPNARAPFLNAKHAAEEAFPDAIRRLVHDRPAYATRRTQAAAGVSFAPAGAEGEVLPGAASGAANPVMSAASIAATARLGQGHAALGRAQIGSVIAMASELRKAMAAHKPWMSGRGNSGALATGLLVNRQGALPSIAPIGRRERGDISAERFTSQFLDPPTPAEQKYSAPMVGAEKKIDPRALRGALADLLDQQGRLPPSGASAFDPLLTPAWPGLQLPA